VRLCSCLFTPLSFITLFSGPASASACPCQGSTLPEYGVAPPFLRGLCPHISTRLSCHFFSVFFPCRAGFEVTSSLLGGPGYCGVFFPSARFGLFISPSFGLYDLSGTCLLVSFPFLSEFGFSSLYQLILSRQERSPSDVVYTIHSGVFPMVSKHDANRPKRL